MMKARRVFGSALDAKDGKMELRLVQHCHDLGCENHWLLALQGDSVLSIAESCRESHVRTLPPTNRSTCPANSVAEQRRKPASIRTHRTEREWLRQCLSCVSRSSLRCFYSRTKLLDAWYHKCWSTHRLRVSWLWSQDLERYESNSNFVSTSYRRPSQALTVKAVAAVSSPE